MNKPSKPLRKEHISNPTSQNFIKKLNENHTQKKKQIQNNYNSSKDKINHMQFIYFANSKKKKLTADLRI